MIPHGLVVDDPLYQHCGSPTFEIGGPFQLEFRECCWFVRQPKALVVFLELFLRVREMLRDLARKDPDFLWSAVEQ